MVVAEIFFEQAAQMSFVQYERMDQGGTKSGRYVSTLDRN